MFLKIRRLQILLVCFIVTVGFLVKPTIAASLNPVTILVVDDFTGKPLLTIADPKLSQAIYDHSFNNDPTKGDDIPTVLDCTGGASSKIVQGSDLTCGDLQQAITDLSSYIQNTIQGTITSQLHGTPFENGLCVANVPELLDQGGAVTTQMGITPIAHGLVVQHVIDTLNTPPTDIKVEPLPNTNFSLEDSITAINGTILAKRGLYVVNMSFAVVACNELPDLAAYEDLIRKSQENGLPNLETTLINLMKNEFADHFGTDHLISVCQPAAKKLSRFKSFQDEPHPELQTDSLEALCGVSPLIVGDNVIAVASAGNFNNEHYPLWPAAWDSVVAVSASTAGKDLLLADGTVDSNWGEVMMPGGWSLADNGHLYSLFGSSFAAPRLSFVMANYLSVVGSDTCHSGDAPALSYGQWLNLNLKAAVAAHCNAIPVP